MTPDIIEFITDPAAPRPRPLRRARGAASNHLRAPAVHRPPRLLRGCTGRDHRPATPFGEVTVVAGRPGREGQPDRRAVVCYEALFGGHEHHLAKGERGVIALVAQDARATRVAFAYVKDYLTGSRLLGGMVAEVLTSAITLTNGLTIECFPCTLRSLRGWTIPVGVLDELAFFRLEGQADSDVGDPSQHPARDAELLRAPPGEDLDPLHALRPALGRLPDGVGPRQPGPARLARLHRAMNPSIRPASLERERRLDPDRFAREYEADFTEDLETFLPGAWIDAAVAPGRHELPPQEGVRYEAAVDPSGGGQDAFTLAIAHAEGTGPDRRIVQDVMRGWTSRRSETTDLEGVVREIAGIVKRYGLSTVVGDRYAAGWVRERFEAEGIRYRDPESDTAQVYLEVEPLFAQGRIELLDHPTLAREFKQLERRPRPGGRTIIDHPRGGHDDHANALALAVVAAMRASSLSAGVVVGVGRRPRPVAPFSRGSALQRVDRLRSALRASR